MGELTDSMKITVPIVAVLFICQASLIAADWKLFGINESTEELVEINQFTGTTTAIMKLPFDAAAWTGFDYNPQDGHLYITQPTTGGVGLYQVNLELKTLTKTRTSAGTGGSLQSIGFTPVGGLYAYGERTAFNQGTLYSLPPNGSVATAIGSSKTPSVLGGDFDQSRGVFWATDEWNGKVYQLSISDSSVLWTSRDTWYPGNGAGDLLDMDVTPDGEVLVGATESGKFVVLLLDPSTGGWSRLITINEAPEFRIASMPLAASADFPDPAAWTLRWSNPQTSSVWYRSWQLRQRSGQFIAGGIHSSDGLEWNSFTLPADVRFWLNDSGVSDGVFILNGAGNDLWNSTNGTNWTKRANGGGYDDLTGIESGNETIVMNRYWSQGSLLVSKDSGNTWTYVDTGGFNTGPGTDGRHYERPVFGGEKFLFPLFDSVRTSSDGLTWETTVVPNRPPAFRMAYVGHYDTKAQKFIGVQQTGSDSSSKTLTIASSADGINWTFHESQLPTANAAEFWGGGIGPGLIMAVGGTPPEVWASSNEGQSWARINGPWESSGVTGVTFAATESTIVAATPEKIYSADLGQLPSLRIEEPVGKGLANSAGAKTFGKLLAGTVSTGRVYTIRNTGAGQLTSIALSKVGSHANDFKVTGPGTSALAPGESTTFSVSFAPTTGGLRTARISLASNDTNRSPFLVNLAGFGIGFNVDSDKDGLSDAAEFLLKMYASNFDWQVKQPELVGMLFSNVNPAGFFTKAQHDANFVSGRTTGRSDVTGKPTSYNLVSRTNIPPVRVAMPKAVAFAINLGGSWTRYAQSGAPTGWSFDTKTGVLNGLAPASGERSVRIVPYNGSQAGPQMTIQLRPAP